jgi:hypothetical protein
LRCVSCRHPVAVGHVWITANAIVRPDSAPDAHRTERDAIAEPDAVTGPDAAGPRSGSMGLRRLHLA